MTIGPQKHPTYRAAAAELPTGSKWSSSFGYPGEGGYAEYHHDPVGNRYVIENGTFGDEWTIKAVPDLPSYEEAIGDAAKARVLFDASKGGKVRGITEDHRFELANVFNCGPRR